jgi:hypothetical protein
MTVPLLFGWEHVLIALVLIVLAAVVALVLLAAGRGGGSREDWQEWLDGRSAQRRGSASRGTDDEAMALPSPRS